MAAAVVDNVNDCVAFPHSLNLDSIPVDPLLYIISFLSRCDVVSLSHVCKKLKEVADKPTIWKNLCQRIWLLDTCFENQTWKETYANMFKGWGRYEKCYAELKGAWNVIEEFLSSNCPQIVHTLNQGCTEHDLNRVEQRLPGCSLPDDLRCSLRIHNGQRFSGPGVAGSMALYQHYKTECLLEVDMMVSGIRHREGLRGCLPITLCVYTGYGKFLVLSGQDGYIPQTVIYPSADRTKDIARPRSAGIHHFICATSYTSWFTSYASNLKNKVYRAIGGQIFNFVHSSSAITNGIKVDVGTAFVPELSCINPPRYLFAYRITISMDSDFQSGDKWQLTTRHWYISDATGSKEEVHGDGVIGEYPIMFPGNSHEYTSCTTFSTPEGHMEGYYTFKKLDKCIHSEINVRVAPFYFHCFPFEHAFQRLERRRKNLVEDRPCDVDVIEIN